MKIVFFGSSHGVPEANRRCSSALIEVGENRYFVDMGTQSIEQLITRNIPIESVKAIFITHMHGDHTDGLPGLVDIMDWYYKTADPAIFLPDLSYVEKLEAWISTFRCGGPVRPKKFCSIREGVIYKDDNVSVTAIRTMHVKGGALPSYAYVVKSVVEGDSSRVLFTGDLSRSCEDYPCVASEKNFSAVVCEAAHFDPRDRREIFENTKTPLFLVNHAGVRLSRDGDGYLREFAEMMPFEVIIVNDGEVYEL